MSPERDHAAAWLNAVRRLDFDAAWQIADAVLAERIVAGPCWQLPRHEQWIWDGRSLTNQRVLLRCYHGLGDTIQFARFLPRLQRIARDVTVWVQPTLIPLLQTFPGIRLLPLHDGTPEVTYDVDVEIMELAHALRVTVDTLPPVPYLSVPPAIRPADEFSVGLMCQSGDWDPRRSVPPDVLLSGLSGLTGVRLFSLQPGAPLPGCVDASATDMLTLASRLRVLDLVITVDTMVAHLAGALGVRTWTLLPHDADWRWLADRVDSPWYPTMRLFRQPTAGDWQAVVRQVGEAIACER
ncbi:MAG TPA: hypothetical protein VGQ62_05735 [Chloroflexota bacterium]|nr:hypothetical protein [Chloroflexota bacterium]